MSTEAHLLDPAYDAWRVELTGVRSARPGRPTTVAERFRYFDFDPEAVRSCSCGWSGVPGFGELYAELVEVACPACGRVLAIVTLPTERDTREAAAAGNAGAIAELPALEERGGFLQRARASALTSADQLPELSGDGLVIDWDFETMDGDQWTVLRHGVDELWREHACWEGYERFGEVFHIVHERYGERLAELRPTDASESWLYGDRRSAPSYVSSLNARLRRQR